MIPKAFLLLFFAYPVFAEGPKYGHEGTEKLEWENAYNEHRNYEKTISSHTAAISSLQTASGKVYQIVFSTDATRTIVTASSYQNTALNASITPSATTSKILACAFGSLAVGSDDYYGYATISRDGTSLFGAGGVGNLFINATSPFIGPWSACYLDSPASVSALNYRVRLKSDGTASTVFLNNFDTGTIVLMEILQ